MARCCDHGERNRLGLECTACGGPTHPAAAPLCAVRRDLLASLRRACGEETRNLARELELERDVFAGSPFGLALTPTRPHIFVVQALGLGLLDRGLLDEHALAFVPPTSAAEPHDDSRQAAVLPRSARQRRVCHAARRRGAQDRRTTCTRAHDPPSPGGLRLRFRTQRRSSPSTARRRRDPVNDETRSQGDRRPVAVCRSAEVGHRCRVTVVTSDDERPLRVTVVPARARSPSQPCQR